ncbi:EAL domain-containing protein [Paraburkholderia sp. CNPSo 3274]|uniref:EAL domain-containing protein n=1 Tax=unclassified Paraburkholderia TaxID=2615204 RepID=UPI0020B846EA|nr:MULTISPECIES: EAL domain-containing protein [unclassified Paraburkholderia]MCP3713530.1 EAL domain-containing protein [Paraburkholderia sp. CNPSo 3274]MCP3721392.1 EAL domain-containing protein [Paraburkholderia sp. CNPSo 3281]
MPTRATLISASIALGCLVTIAPVLTSLYVASEDVARRDRDDLNEFAQKAVMRMDLVTYQAFAALADLERVADAPCSQSSLEWTARVIFRYTYVQDAGAFADGRYLCSPLLGDMRMKDEALPPPDYRTSDGYLLWFRQKSPLSAGRTGVQIGRNGHYVALAPSSYVDVIDPEKRPIAAIHIPTATVFAVSPGADPAEMLSAWRHRGDVMSDKWIYAVSQSPTRPIAVVVKAPRGSVAGSWPKLLAAWLSIGVAAGAALGWLAYKRVSRQLSFAATLEWAISRREIDVVYQPVVRLADEECVGVEALVRWQWHGRTISPDIFVPIAEENHLIQALTDLVLEKTLAQLGKMLVEKPSFYVSINLSAEDLRSFRFLNLLTASLKGTGIAPRQIRIEATERSFMNADATRGVIAAFRAAGHPIYIDDFGTGYSSLSYLQTFELDVLKIDKSFVDTIGRDTASSVVAPHIIAMAHELNLELVAEGAESGAQVAWLREKGVQYVQGWYYAKAMSAHDLAVWLGVNRAPRHADSVPEI